MLTVTLKGSPLTPGWQLAQNDEDDPPHRLYGGMLYLAGLGRFDVAIHVQAIRCEDERGREPFTEDDRTEFEAVLGCGDNEDARTTEIEGYPGHWMVYMLPAEA